MSLFRKFSGDTDRFAVEIRFEREGDATRGIPADYLTSWGEFQLWVNGQNLCAATDNVVSLDSVHWYLLPLLEWFTEQWDFIFHEKRFTAPSSRWRTGQDFLTEQPLWDLSAEQQDMAFEWRGRHCISTCREGGLFPDLVIRRREASVELSWGNVPPPGTVASFRFLYPPGFACFPPDVVAQPLYEVLRDTSTYLLHEVPGSERLRGLHQRIAGLAHPEQKVRRLSILAGLGRSLGESLSLWNQICDRIRIRAKSSDAASSLLDLRETNLFLRGSCSAALMFGSVSPTIDEHDRLLLADRLVGYYSPQGDPEPLIPLVAEKPIDLVLRPWQDGYKLADSLLEQLSLRDTKDSYVDIEAVLGRLGVAVEDFELSDTGIRAIALAGSMHRPAILLNSTHPTNRYPSGRRFTLAHELCHILYDRCYGTVLAIASGPWAPADVEQRANAFAARFLMPVELIQKACLTLTVPLETLDGILAISQELRVSLTSLVHHLRNLALLNDEIARDLLEEAVRIESAR